MERTDAELIAAVRKGDAASFEPLVRKYSARLFGMARRYARGESEVAPRSNAEPVPAGAHRCSSRPTREQPAAPWTISMPSKRVGSATAAHALLQPTPPRPGATPAGARLAPAADEDQAQQLEHGPKSGCHVGKRRRA